MDREILESRIADGATVGELAAEARVDRSTMRRWLRRYGLATRRMRAYEQAINARAEDLTWLNRVCATHGETEHRRDNRGGYKCVECNRRRVSNRRRKVKAILVAEAGSKCTICGYDTYAGALHFHHVDPSNKRYHLGDKGITRSLARSREEAAKCVLLCANCHAEIEAGLVALPITSSS
jgi:hypothetical protein